MTRRANTNLGQHLQRLDTLKRIKLQTDLERFFLEQKVYDQNKPILMMARAIKEELRQDLPDIIAQKLYRAILKSAELQQPESMDELRQRLQADLPSSELLKAIVALARPQREIEGVQAIVNYNYDNLLEETLQRENVPCMTILSGRNVQPPHVLPVYHVHGALPLSNIAAEQYESEAIFARATGWELPHPHNDIFDRIFFGTEDIASVASSYGQSPEQIEEIYGDALDLLAEGRTQPTTDPASPRAARVRSAAAYTRYGNFVFSEDEYHTEYSDPYRWSNMTQISHLGRYTGLFIGLSMEDPNLRRLIDVTHKQFPEVRNYAIIKRRDRLGSATEETSNIVRNLFESMETASFDSIGVSVLWVDDHNEIPSLVQKVCELEQPT
jgi:hypothetical protein